MNENRVEGTARNLGGKAQEGFGKVIGNARTRIDMSPCLARLIYQKQRLCLFLNLILLDIKFLRQIFYFAKSVFPFSNRDAVFTSRFFRKYHELPH